MPTNTTCRLAFQCTLYLIIWVRDVRRAGKTLSIFQIKKTRGGPLVTVQALCAYILSNLLCGKQPSKIAAFMAGSTSRMLKH